MKDKRFLKARAQMVENLENLLFNLQKCVNEGMEDAEAKYYNELFDLIEDAKIAQGWDELEELLPLAKTLEVDVATWFAYHGRATLSYEWPSPSDISDPDKTE